MYIIQISKMAKTKSKTNFPGVCTFVFLNAIDFRIVCLNSVNYALKSNNVELLINSLYTSVIW